jgi:hypothetical protein
MIFPYFSKFSFHFRLYLFAKSDPLMCTSRQIHVDFFSFIFLLRSSCPTASDYPLIIVYWIILINMQLWKFCLKRVEKRLKNSKAKSDAKRANQKEIKSGDGHDEGDGEPDASQSDPSCQCRNFKVSFVLKLIKFAILLHSSISSSTLLQTCHIE